MKNCCNLKKDQAPHQTNKKMKKYLRPRCVNIMMNASIFCRTGHQVSNKVEPKLTFTRSRLELSLLICPTVPSPPPSVQDLDMRPLFPFCQAKKEL